MNVITKPIFVRKMYWRNFDGTIHEAEIHRHEIIWQRGWWHIKGARKIARQRKRKS